MNVLYCKDCMKLVGPTDRNRCPHCNRKKLREPQNEDPVFILNIDATFAASVGDILAQNNIPCIKRGNLGAGIVSYVGYSMEDFNFYVPYELLKKTRGVLENFIEDRPFNEDKPFNEGE